ncbi:MAG: ribosomal protein S18-alanine N-acetyltransferase [Vibrio sp.]
MSQQKYSPIHLHDLTEIYRIEQKAHIQPWSLSMLENINGYGAFNQSLKVNDKIIGYFYSQLIVDELSLLTIAIDPDYQSQGYGKQLFQYFIAQGKEKGANSIYLEVRPSNQAAIKLYQDFGFEEIARRSKYYANPSLDDPNGREDAIVMKVDV